MTSAQGLPAPYDFGMDVAIGRSGSATDKPAAPPPSEPPEVLPGGAPPGADLHEGELGTSSGVNIAPGSDDDGWTVPPPVKLSDGSLVQLYKDGEALHAAYEAIKSAKKRVCLESYIFASDDTGRAFADLLSKKAREGLDVYVIYDSFGSFASDREMFRAMARSGVRVREFHPVRPWECKYSWRPANRDHRKILFVDDDRAGLGGLNVGGEYGGSWVTLSKKGPDEFWRDNAVSIRGPSARYLLKAFGKTWNYIGRGGRIGATELNHNLKPGEGDFGLLATVPTPRSPLRTFLCDLMGCAKKSVYITMAYFAPHDELIEEICKADKRGVRVRLMLPGRSDVKVVQIAARSFYEKLMSCGVEIYERQVVVLHSKTMVVDARVSVVGSTNLDHRSIEYNCELSTVVRSEAFGRQMVDLFENDVMYAKRISLKEWRKRPWSDRVVQWGVSRARYLM